LSFISVLPVLPDLASKPCKLFAYSLLAAKAG
jgi:hypothetical protein